MKIPTLLISIILNSICFAQPDPIVVELNDGRIYTYNISEIQDISIFGSLTSAEEKQLAQVVLNSFTLRQNFPNPFNPNTNIVYEISNPGSVGINIYNIQGQLVYSFGTSEQEAGIHTVSWNGRNDSGILVSSGTYFCSVCFNNTFFTKKMLLIR